KTTDPTNNDGGVDDMNGNEDRDVIMGGVKGDNLNGNGAGDIILGDEGQVEYNLGGPDCDGDMSTGDRSKTTSFTLGGNDTLIGDQGEVDQFNGKVTRIITTDVVDADGGVDDIFGNEGDDVILGGVKGDHLHGNDGNDIILGDEGQLQFNLTGPNRDGNPDTVDNIETLQPNLGGSDVIEGNAGNDRAFGGAAGDFVYGDADLPAVQD